MRLTWRKWLGVILYVALLLAGAVVCALRLPRGFDTDLASFAGEGNGLLSALVQKTSNRIRVLCGTPEATAACRAVHAFDAPTDPDALLDLLRRCGKGLLSERDRELLAAGDTNRIVRSARRRDFSGVGLLSKADDPCYLLTNFATDLAAFQPPQLAAGETLLQGTAGPGLDRLIDLARTRSDVWLSGAPFHSRLATERSVREINLLGGVSLAAVLLLGWLLFRSFRFVLPTVFALAGGFLVGTAAVLLLPGRPHVATFIFGTSLIGLGVDYCYHALAHRPASDAAAFHSTLAGALVSTCLTFSPLLFATVPVLSQMAAFTIAGLVTVYFAARHLLRPLPVSATGSSPADSISGAGNAASSRWTAAGRTVMCLVVLVAFCGICRLGFSSDPADLHRPDPLLAQGERIVAERCGSDALAFEVVPLAAWQAENAALKRKLGIVPPGRFLTAADLPDWATVKLDGEDHLLLPSAKGIRVRDLLRRHLSGCMASAWLLLAVSGCVLALVMVLGFKGRFFPCLDSVIGAVLATAGTLGWLGVRVTFFHLLCVFVFVGLGVDYAIFHRCGSGGDRLRARVVLTSFLTSFVGLGMLAFTSLQVLRLMGVTLAIGLAFSYLLALLFARPRVRAETGTAATAWQDQGEQSAGRGRLLLMWLLYRWLGKSAAKILFLPAWVFIYPFCRAGRDALAEFRAATGLPVHPFRHLLGFAWSLLDKVDACTLAKDLPRYTVRGDRGWMKGGCFLLSTHLGCIEVLPGLRDGGEGEGNRAVRVHAFQQLGHDAVFTRLFLKHLDPNRLTLHAVEEIGVETAVEMQAAIARGEMVLMAGDRVPAEERTRGRRVLEQTFFGRTCRWPKGVFRFARLMDCDAYAIVCVRTGWNAYDVVAERLPRGEGEMLAAYAAFLERETRAHPDQWYQFYRFFPS